MSEQDRKPDPYSIGIMGEMRAKGSQHPELMIGNAVNAIIRLPRAIPAFIRKEKEQQESSERFEQHLMELTRTSDLILGWMASLREEAFANSKATTVLGGIAIVASKGLVDSGQTEMQSALQASFLVFTLSCLNTLVTYSERKKFYRKVLEQRQTNLEY